MSQVIVVQSIAGDSSPWMPSKGDIVLAALSELGINGTAAAAAAEQATALDKLETMMYDFESRNMCVGYNFEEEPHTDSPHGIPRKFKNAIESNLAMRLSPALEIQVNPVLERQAAQALGALAGQVLMVRQVSAPTRSPIGSGSSFRRHRYRRFNAPTARPSINCDSVNMRENEIRTITLSFIDSLADDDVLQTVVAEVTTGITLTFNADEYQVVYKISSTTPSNLEQIKFTAQTAQGNAIIKIVDVSVSNSDIDGVAV